MSICMHNLCFKQSTPNVFLKVLSEPHCVRSGMCPLILPLSSWRKPESKYPWREPLRTKEDPGCNFFSSHSNMQTAGEFICVSLYGNVTDDRESLTVPCIALCISVSPLCT